MKHESKAARFQDGLCDRSDQASAVVLVLKTLWHKMGYSVAGLVDTWRSESSFRQWILVVAVSDVAAIIWAPSVFGVALIFAFGFLLLAAELINTAVEAIVDQITPERHPLAKKSKDAASAMTFVTFLSLLSIWIGIFLID